MKFITFNSYSNKPLFIRAEYILGFSEHGDHTEENPKSTVLVANIETSEDWHIKESVESIRKKLEKY